MVVVLTGNGSWGSVMGAVMLLPGLILPPSSRVLFADSISAQPQLPPALLVSYSNGKGSLPLRLRAGECSWWDL